MGGGNCANALTAAARLGVDSYLVSQIGGDGVGEQIEQELSQDHVHTDFLLKAKDHPSPFTYIIVDKTGILKKPYVMLLYIEHQMFLDKPVAAHAIPNMLSAYDPTGVMLLPECAPPCCLRTSPVIAYAALDLWSMHPCS